MTIIICISINSSFDNVTWLNNDNDMYVDNNHNNTTRAWH